jgi:hypothetical protein
MFDELERLKDTIALQHLLAHYAQAGVVDRERWQDRLMQCEGVEAKELVKLHGELIAYGWVEQNLGTTASAKPGVVAACYRVTAAGLRAWQHAQYGPAEEGTGEAALPVTSEPGGILPVDVGVTWPKRRRGRKPRAVVQKSPSDAPLAAGTA